MNIENVEQKSTKEMAWSNLQVCLEREDKIQKQMDNLIDSSADSDIEERAMKIFGQQLMEAKKEASEAMQNWIDAENENESIAA